MDKSSWQSFRILIFLHDVPGGVVVERKIKNSVGKMTPLTKFTDGEAKDHIKYCIHLTPKIGYNTALTLPNEMYGNVQKQSPRGVL